MNVAAALNGQLISEQAARYAIQHAASLKASCILLHLVNTKDKIQRVRQSFEELKVDAKRLGVPLILEEGHYDLESFLRKAIDKYRIDVLFCSTRAQKRFYEASFSEEVLRYKLGVKLAIVRIASGMAIQELNAVATYAPDQELQVSVFNLAASFSSLHKAKLIIATDIPASEKKLSQFEFSKRRKLVRKADQNLTPFIKLSRLLGIRCRVKHVLRDHLSRDLMPYLISRRIKLLILEKNQLARWWKFMDKLPFSSQNEIESLFHNVPINCILLVNSN